jgi:hypothetical protein
MSVQTNVRPIIFLDIDGVLNNMSYNPSAESYTFDRQCVGYFNYLIEKLQPNIVISSAWRYMILQNHMSISGFRYLMQSHGVTSKINIVGITESDQRYPLRAEAVLAYLQDNNLKDYPYIILDDNDFGFTNYNLPFVQTNGKSGLTYKDCERVLSMFENPSTF